MVLLYKIHILHYLNNLLIIYHNLLNNLNILKIYYNFYIQKYYYKINGKHYYICVKYGYLNYLLFVNNRIYKKIYNIIIIIKIVKMVINIINNYYM